ncbi:MAG TPA: SDR family oxidoreductase [Dehalococcoidia bacterium]|nr:SDR family oxidoreductase [Dehalococcoidia bacterium]
MDLELRGRRAIVTGGSRGIGKAIALELAREGVDIAICARDRATLDAAAADIRALGVRAAGIEVDAGNRASVDAAVEEAVAQLGGVDILVNSAGQPGGLATGPLPTVTDEDVLEDFNAKTFGTLRFCRAVAPHLQQQGWGRIINIGGLSGRQPGTYSTGMRNVAITHLTRTLSLELAPSGITVNIVHPGMTRTEWAAGRWAEAARRQGLPPEEGERIASERALMKRVVDTSEIAYVVAFLASPKASAVSGEVIGVGGGEPGRSLFL